MKIWLAVAMLVAAVGVTRLPAQEGAVAVGARAPVVQVHDLDGHPVDLARYLGKQPVFLEWWATWCENCEALLPRVTAARAEVGDRVAFFGINVAVNQTPERVRRFLQKTEVPYRTLYDDQGVSTRAYGAPATSYVVIVDRAGQVAYTGLGRDQDFLPTLRRVAAQ
jgi:peroxiredoxin